MKLRSSVPLVLIVILSQFARGDEPLPAAMTGCSFVADNYFIDEVWSKVGAGRCLTCHNTGGDAEDSQFVLRDPQRFTGKERDDAMRYNRDAFVRMAKVNEGDRSRMLLKATGRLDHGGKEVLP